jgi:pimeloyl-ACP methyl ester carboxylesterase
VKRRDLIIGSTTAALAAALPKLADAATNTMEGNNMTRPNSGYAPVNGIQLYYEVHGTGKPLVLLHGGFGSFAMFGGMLPTLIAGRQVIGVDLQGHGHTLPGDRPMSFDAFATDVAELIKWLGHEKVDVMGYSMGASTAPRLAINHPALVDRLISTSTVHAFAGWHDYNQQGMKSIGVDPVASAEGMKQTPMYEAYAREMPDAERNWIKTVTLMGNLTGAEYDWSDDIPKIKAPTLIIVGDWDAVRTSYVAKMFELLGGGKQDAMWDGSGMNANRLAILPGVTHYTMFMDPRLATTAIGFLES